MRCVAMICVCAFDVDFLGGGGGGGRRPTGPPPRGGTLAPARAQYGYTALIWAARNDHADCTRLLLDAGADKNAKDEVRVSLPCLVFGSH